MPNRINKAVRRTHRRNGAASETTVNTPARRVLFLDIDGVLHPAADAAAPGGSAMFLEVGQFGWLPHLERLLAPHPDVQLVVHSSWRETFRLAELADMLADVGNHRVDVTPPGERYGSILLWLRARPGACYLILDDDAREFPAPAPAELVLCSPEKGVSDQAVLLRLERWLNGTSSQAAGARVD